MKPINRTKQKKSYNLLGFILYILIVYLFLHVGKLIDNGWDISPEFITALLNHILEEPFDVFPINKEYLAKGALFGIIAPLLLHSEYLRRRDLRPNESGSARWTEDLKKFYKTYVEMTTWPAIFDQNVFLKKVKSFLLKVDAVLSKIPIIRFFYKKIANAIAGVFQKPHQGSGSPNMILSKEVFLSMNGRKTMRNCNTLIIGGSGTGKSRFEAKPNILQANASFVVTDPSGELLESVGSFLEQEGYEIRVFNLVQMDHSHCYNPFHYIRNQAGVPMMINTLIKNTNPKDSTKGDPFWEKSETALLQAICFFLVSECNKEDQNFSNVMKLLRCAKAVEGQEDVDSTLDIMFKDLEARDSNHIAVKSYKTFKAAGGGKTAQSILISCLVRLQTFDLDDINQLTCIDNIDLGSMGEKKVALFCITPSADTTFNYLVALLYTQLFETLYYRAENMYGDIGLPVHVRFIMDEFANIANIPDFNQKLSTMRKYQISCTVIVQALSQLKALYKDDWDVLVGNCDSQIFLGGSDATTLEYFSKALGKETIRSVNDSRSYGKQGSHSISYNKTGRELMTPEELRTMDNKNCIIFIRGEDPFFAVKYPYEKHPNYKYTGDANKKLKYNVRNLLKTGQNPSALKVKERGPMKVFKEAQIADTRPADRQRRVSSRKPDMKSARNRDLLKPRPLTEEFPGINKRMEERTAAEQEQLREALENVAFMDMDKMTEEQMLQHQMNVYQMNFSPQHEGAFGMSELGADEERAEE